MKTRDTCAESELQRSWLECGVHGARNGTHPLVGRATGTVKHTDKHRLVFFSFLSSTTFTCGNKRQTFQNYVSCALTIHTPHKLKPLVLELGTGWGGDSPCTTHLSRTGSLLCLTTAWTSLVVSPATGVSFTSSSSSSWRSCPLWNAALAGSSSPITGNCPFSAPPFNSRPSSPSSFLLRTLSWTLLVQWFFLFFKLLDMAPTGGGGGDHMSAAAEEVVSLAEVLRRDRASSFSGGHESCPCPRTDSPTRTAAGSSLAER